MKPVVEALESRAYLSATVPIVALLDGEPVSVPQVIKPAATPRGIDLTGAFVSYPKSAKLGKSMAVTMEIKNNGRKTASGTLAVLFEFSSNPSGGNPFQVATLTTRIKLRTGKHVNVPFSVPLALGGITGDEYVVAVVDPMNVFKESKLSDKVSVSSKPVDVT